MDNTEIKQDKKSLWIHSNKDKIASYARNYYHKRCEADPTYKKTLCDKVKSNNQKRSGINIRSVGRPLKYGIPV
jgi:hypothetical protein